MTTLPARPASTCTWTCPGPKARRASASAWRRRSATPSGPGASVPAPGCRPRGPWPAIWAWPATRWPRCTASWSRRAGLPPGPVRGPRSPNVPPPSPGLLARPEASAPRYDLRPGVPDLSAFPGGAWLATARKVLATAPRSSLDYPDRRGLPQLRTVLAGYLARARGVAADPGHIVICAGFAHGLAVACAALRSAGAATLAVEAYGHRAHRDLAQAQGLHLRPLPVDGRGAMIGAADGADAALLTPAHQFPLGVTLHPQRRRDAARWGGVVIEDDYDGEFRYDRQPVGALQALAPDHVIYAGTASKSLIPALRLGWLVVPARVLDAVTAQLT